ncbi:MAG TPA: DUF4239 domain-containing protein [Gammaproteobacteria bacterium]|jgi:hypothetical protein|nr:DUF4239 domain-containing protein [Gammaproteobacteria bacterium]
MGYTVVAVLIMFFSAIAIFSVIGVGRMVGKGRPHKQGLDITEGAIFTLMALLVAFTFSNAHQRFDSRRLVIVDEANAISTAFLRLDVLRDQDKIILKKDFKDYIDARIAIYQSVPDMKKVANEILKSRIIQTRLWKNAVAAVVNTQSSSAPILVLPAINSMFDIATTRMAYSIMHPPLAIFLLLIIVVILSAFLTGYGMEGRRGWGALHIIAFAIITAITIYVIIDLEYPRLGVIQEGSFDVMLQDVRDSM